MNEQNKFGSIWSCIVEVMNFLIYRDFSRIFPNFYKIYFGFIWIYKIKKLFLFCPLTWQLMCAIWRHVYVTRGIQCALVCACVLLCASVMSGFVTRAKRGTHTSLHVVTHNPLRRISCYANSQFLIFLIQSKSK